jgi:hypothetical protein
MNWQRFLEQFSRELLADPSVRESVPEAVRKSGWMGFAPASEEKIQRVEAKLKMALPPSYREFLAVTNGWRCTGPFIHKLWGTSKIAWFSKRNQDWIDAYTDDGENDDEIDDEEYFVYGPEQSTVTFRNSYLRAALEISDCGDSAIYLLNPEVKTRSGEWEAWFFANWLPGARRFRSFEDLMKDARVRIKTQ